MKSKWIPPVGVTVILALSVVASVWIGLSRVKVERSHRAVHIACGIDDIRNIAAAAGQDITTTCRQLANSGLTSVVVNEETFEDLVLAGKLLPVPGSPQKLLCANGALATRLKSIAQTRFPKGTIRLKIVLSEGSTIGFPLSYRELKFFGAGFDPLICDAVRKTGLRLIARVGNPPSASDSVLTAVVQEAVAAGADGLMLQGDQVLGWRDRVKNVAQIIKDSPLWYGSVEFGNQAGDSRLSFELLADSHEPHLLRVHSMLAAEMNLAVEPSIVDRYVRAAAERNIKVLYLRPRGASEADPVAGFGELISQITRGLRRDGMDAKTPTLMTAPEYPAFLPWIVAIGGFIFCIWFFSSTVKPDWALALFILFAAGTLVLMGLGSDLGVKFAALAIGIAVPTWGVLAAFANENAPPSPWLTYVLVSAFSLVGGLMCAALLTKLNYMFHADQFMGVKAAHFLPPILVGALLITKQRSFKQVLDGSPRWLDVVLTFVIAGALMLVVLRTGNDSPGAVSGWELRLRDLMDRVLPERPRTKEIFFGHPAFIIGLLLAQLGKRRWLPLLAVIAAIGQASILNTFCHLHTPLLTTLVRVLTGMVCGGIIGFVIWLLVRRQVRGSQSSLDLS